MTNYIITVEKVIPHTLAGEKLDDVILIFKGESTDYDFVQRLFSSLTNNIAYVDYRIRVLQEVVTRTGANVLFRKSTNDNPFTT